ncbi:hypothetical protein ERW49_04650 [Aliivibrio finisterrensis]|uniref:Glycoside hydrolase family 2 catalytic domain-containing protein n=1 Tax=Aliivibrio finisterrensis TaxID=511998 RepID=A0A4Q5KMQ4_9GAMM|nr:hypothetical protein ERW49_04650 [Aliivibrio finisterrensis]
MDRLKILPYYPLQQNNAIHELIHRNKNHPCIVMGSLSNEPDTSQEASNGYFKDIFESGLW